MDLFCSQNTRLQRRGRPGITPGSLYVGPPTGGADHQRPIQTYGIVFWADGSVKGLRRKKWPDSEQAVPKLPREGSFSGCSRRSPAVPLADFSQFLQPFSGLQALQAGGQIGARQLVPKAGSKQKQVAVIALISPCPRSTSHRPVPSSQRAPRAMPGRARPIAARRGRCPWPNAASRSSSRPPGTDYGLAPNAHRRRRGSPANCASAA